MIVKNEEAVITRAIQSVQFADEVIVVDAESTDRTVEIAKSLGAKTLVRPWPGYGRQRNYSASQAAGEWLLVIDADEEVTPALAREIESIIHSEQSDGIRGLGSRKDFYWLRIVTIFLGKPLTHLFGHNLRLFKKSAGRWTDQAVHEQIKTAAGQPITLGDSAAGLLIQPLLHYSHPTVASYRKRMNRYTTLDADEMLKHDRHRSGRSVKPAWWLPAYLAARQFLKMYFYKRGFLDGYAGLIWCALSSQYEYGMAKKYLILKNVEKSRRRYF